MRMCIVWLLYILYVFNTYTDLNIYTSACNVLWQRYGWACRALAHQLSLVFGPPSLLA